MRGGVGQCDLDGSCRGGGITHQQRRLCHHKRAQVSQTHGRAIDDAGANGRGQTLGHLASHVADLAHRDAHHNAADSLARGTVDQTSCHQALG